jgi:hypothetical protein
MDPYSPVPEDSFWQRLDLPFLVYFCYLQQWHVLIIDCPFKKIFDAKA